jgi:NADPH2:quinone reductase
MSITARTIRIYGPGGSDKLRLYDMPLAEPGDGEVLVRQTAIGVNYLDVYVRRGVSGDVPSPIGAEAAGVVELVGADVKTFRVGDRVAYGGSSPGAYADYRIVPADRLVPIPDYITDEAAAALLMKGMTVEYLLNRCFAVGPGHQVLFYAAAGGVGAIAGQWGRHLGARMIGVTGGEARCALARAQGYDAVIDRTTEKIAPRVRTLTDGKGVMVAYDSVGKDTFHETLASLAPRGLFVTFGSTTGAPPPLEASLLQKHGSLYYTRPTLATYIASRDDLIASAAAVFDLVAKGVLEPKIGQRYRLDEAAAAHEALEAGDTRGSTILIP